MRSNRAAGSFLEIVDRLEVTRFCRLAEHIENEHAARIKAGQPNLMAVVGKSGVMQRRTTWLCQILPCRAIHSASARRLFIHARPFLRSRFPMLVAFARPSAANFTITIWSTISALSKC